MNPVLTGSQTVGPFFERALTREDAVRHVLVGPDTPGERVRIQGRLLDGDGQAVPDGLIEIWQANAAGRYNHPADTRRDLPLDPDFLGFGRCGTDEDGGFWFETVKPGRVPLNGQMQAPHIVVTVFSRGLLNHCVTRLYFADEPANHDDPILQRVPPERRATLLAQPQAIEGAVQGYSWDIHLQGSGETAFLNV